MSFNLLAAGTREKVRQVHGWAQADRTLDLQVQLEACIHRRRGKRQLAGPSPRVMIKNWPIVSSKREATKQEGM